MNSNKKLYYVYEHWLDGICFYVGKGSYIHNRAYIMKDSSRNDKWKQFVGNRKNDVEVIIVKEFEDELSAYEYEEILSIKRQLEGYELQCEKLGNKMTSELKEKFAGKNNPMFGKNAYENKTKEEMDRIQKNKSEKMKGKFTGSKNPMYGKKHTKDFYKWQSERTRGGNNPRAKKVKIILNGKVEIFSCLKDAVDKYGTMVCRLVKSELPYEPTYKKHKHLKGMVVKYISMEDM